MAGVYCWSMYGSASMSMCGGGSMSSPGCAMLEQTPPSPPRKPQANAGCHVAHTRRPRRPVPVYFVKSPVNFATR
eukprot:4920133-Prymnesium_polylepis.1